MCEYGARHYKTGGLIKHPAKLLVTHKEFEQLRRTCSHKSHDQTLGDGVAVRKSGVYPTKFCRAVVRIIEQIIRQQGVHHAYVNDTASLGETGEPTGGPAPQGAHGGDAPKAQRGYSTSLKFCDWCGEQLGRNCPRCMCRQVNFLVA